MCSVYYMSVEISPKRTEGRQNVRRTAGAQHDVWKGRVGSKLSATVRARARDRPSLRPARAHCLTCERTFAECGMLPPHHATCRAALVTHARAGGSTTSPLLQQLRPRTSPRRPGMATPSASKSSAEQWAQVASPSTPKFADVSWQSSRVAPPSQVKRVELQRARLCPLSRRRFTKARRRCC